MGNNPINATDPNGGQINYLRATQGQINAGNAGISGLRYSQAMDAALQADAQYRAELTKLQTTISGVQNKINHSMATVEEIINYNLAVYELRGFYHKYNQDNMNGYSESRVPEADIINLGHEMSSGLASNAVNIDDDSYTFSIWGAIDRERRNAFYSGTKAFRDQSMQWVNGNLQWIVTEDYIRQQFEKVRKNLPKQLLTGRIQDEIETEWKIRFSASFNLSCGIIGAKLHVPLETGIWWAPLGGGKMEMLLYIDFYPDRMWANDWIGGVTFTNTEYESDLGGSIEDAIGAEVSEIKETILDYNTGYQTGSSETRDYFFKSVEKGSSWFWEHIETTGPEGPTTYEDKLKFGLGVDVYLFLFGVGANMNIEVQQIPRVWPSIYYWPSATVTPK